MTFDQGKNFDLLVVGAGPAGAVAAKEAAQKELKVLVVEAKQALGEKCHCAEWVPALLALEVAIGGDVRRARLDRLTTTAGKRSAQAKVSGMVLERKIWELSLALEAAQAGAVVRAGTRFKGWAGPGRVLLQGAFDQKEIRVKAVIAADGGLSAVVSSLGLERNTGVPALQVEVDAGPNLKEGLVLFREDLFGYLWLFPKGATANLGLGGEPLGSISLKQMLAEWRAQVLTEGLVGPSIIRQGGGFIPTGGPRESFLGDAEGVPVLLTGDAAGLTHPTTGAGIPQAVRSGLMAGEAVVGYTSGRDMALPEYEKVVKSFLGGYLNRGLRLRDKAKDLWSGDFEQAVKTYWPLWPRK